MATSIADANIKASGEVAVGPLFSRTNDTPSDTSLEKDNSNVKHTSSSEHGFDPNLEGDSSRQHGTFATINDKSFYTPIDRYEGRHRYDPNFQWEPKEEKKLVRKVSLWIVVHQGSMDCTDDSSLTYGYAPSFA